MLATRYTSSCLSHLTDVCQFFFLFFFFNDTATTEIYTLSLHDALPISVGVLCCELHACDDLSAQSRRLDTRDRKSTRLNSSHTVISYAVFCLKKKKQLDNRTAQNK